MRERRDPEEREKRRGPAGRPDALSPLAARPKPANAIPVDMFADSPTVADRPAPASASTSPAGGAWISNQDGPESDYLRNASPAGFFFFLHQWLPSMGPLGAASREIKATGRLV